MKSEKTRDSYFVGNKIFTKTVIEEYSLSEEFDMDNVVFVSSADFAGKPERPSVIICEPKPYETDYERDAINLFYFLVMCTPSMTFGRLVGLLNKYNSEGEFPPAMLTDDRWKKSL